MSETTRYHAPGTLGIGVGYYFEPIAARGETEPVFQSVTWFPSDRREDAIAYAEEATAQGGVTYEVKDGVPL